MDVAKLIVLLILLGLLIVFIMFGPVFTIWSLNVLFALEIPVTFKTWCAVIWLMTILHAIRINLKKEG